MDMEGSESHKGRKKVRVGDDVSIEIEKKKEERSNKKSSDVLEWVNRNRKIDKEKKKTQKEKPLQLSKIFEEQDHIGEDHDHDATQGNFHNLAGVKVVHGLDKVIMEGGEIVLTLKDQSILADGCDNINEDVDMLENVEIGEQKLRNQAAKKTGKYDDKYDHEPAADDQGLALDEKGNFLVRQRRNLKS
ncbi:SART-1 family protein DOT2 [Quillaja saponaria]|uniref:SART-1 family protein DOT2 n=1 Tax=Quillaja saponaria TaxID=32244 RepID=A0AAD7LUY4_QUISA|nr:SART-1 family protein DOT2 [Quillaja saponaria]